ncbi:MAG: single-stranded DNA-binding protein [Elusimicrobiota bacterium]
MKDIRLLQQNIVLIAGHLARDPEFRVTPGGAPVCNFRVGVSRRFKDGKTGDWKDETTWINVEVWREAAERLKDQLKKGSPVHVEGRLKSEDYEDKQGQKRTMYKVVANRVQALEKRDSGASSSSGKAAADIEEVPF